MAKTRFFVLALLIVLLGLGGLACRAQADTLYLNDYPGLSGISVNYPSYSGTAGEFQIGINNGPSYTTNAIGYCVDFSKSVDMPPSGPYSGYTLSAASGQSNIDLQLSAWIVNQYAPGLGQTSWYSSISGATTDTARAAVQLAIWEVMAETTTNPQYSVSNGSFRLTTDPSHGVAASLANGILATMYSDLYNQSSHQYVVDAASISGVNFASSQTHQNFLTASTSPVPIPPSVFLFGSGLAGLGVFRRFRKN